MKTLVAILDLQFLRANINILFIWIIMLYIKIYNILLTL